VSLGLEFGAISINLIKKIIEAKIPNVPENTSLFIVYIYDFLFSFYFFLHYVE
jgi:hypothetical protein